ncbi:uncharacterized protein LOC125314264 [Rhodamnia argentea]|uniref:Uncharacterized protein LOC125314264 n=1 Tax=Rhodamnia argentea TaxID=178133 RepID=A0ABM3H6B7_9MYRT|nr:uncharacterized protein LOC125314264 [Rhodamnia argentea]
MLENKLVATTFSASNSTLEEIYDAVAVVKFPFLMLSIVAKKHFPILLIDYLWRLVGVAMGGQLHNQLTGAGIVTVRDFVDLPGSIKTEKYCGWQNLRCYVETYFGACCIMSPMTRNLPRICVENRLPEL